jgi:hypothetical protein
VLSGKSKPFGGTFGELRGGCQYFVVDSTTSGLDGRTQSIEPR